MKSRKSMMRELKSAPDSTGDRRAGSVGERPELVGSRDNDDRSGNSIGGQEEEEDVGGRSGHGSSDPLK